MIKLKEILNEQIPSELYHATFNALIPSISNDGLVPNGKNFKNFEDIEWGVYLSNDKDFAGSMVQNGTENENIPNEWLDEVVICIIDTTHLDRRLFDKDPQVNIDPAPSEDPNGIPKSYVYRGIIPPSAIKDIIDYD